MFYRKRHLNRLWEIEIFQGDPEDPNTETRKETIIALNAVAAIRQAGGRVVRQPVALFFVTHPKQDPEGDIYRINSPQEGPVGGPIQPTICPPEGEEDWR